MERADRLPSNPDSFPRTPRFRWGFLGTLAQDTVIRETRVEIYPDGFGALPRSTDPQIRGYSRNDRDRDMWHLHIRREAQQLAE